MRDRHLAVGKKTRPREAGRWRWRIPRRLPSKRVGVLSLTPASRDPPSRRGLPGPPARAISSPAGGESGSTVRGRRGWGPRRGADDLDGSETDDRSLPAGPGSNQRVGSLPLSGFRFLDGFLAALQEQMLPSCTAGEALSLVAEGARKTEQHQGQGRRPENTGTPEATAQPDEERSQVWTTWRPAAPTAPAGQRPRPRAGRGCRPVIPSEIRGAAGSAQPCRAGHPGVSDPPRALDPASAWEVETALGGEPQPSEAAACRGGETDRRPARP